MLPISILEKSNNSILYEIPHGKPDPKQLCVVNEESRDRVVQAANKGNGCWYYTFNFIRKRIGKNHEAKLIKEREVERLCSLRRKELTAYDNAFPVSFAQLYSQEGEQLFKTMDLEKVQFFLKTQETLQIMSNLGITLGGRSSLYPYFQEFVKENKHKTMYEFLVHKRCCKLIEVNMNFIKNFPNTIQKTLEHEKWNTISIEVKAAYVDACARNLTAIQYGLHKSTWKPGLNVDGLITELKNNGPLMVLGDFGASAYIDPPFKMNAQLAGRDIYAWKPGAKREISDAKHTVLLIGAKKIQEKAYVYFIDCCDQSDPKDRSKQKIYMISFANLTSNIFDIAGRRILDSNVEYAFYGNFKI